MSTLRIQSVLFHNEPHAIDRALKNIYRAAEFAVAEGVFSSVEVAYGDCSAEPIFSDEIVAKMRILNNLLISYTFFNSNLGSAKGHNTLLANATTDYVLIMNPDVVISPNTLIELMLPFKLPNVGMVEARQTPIEHPKSYNAITGETGWASTACTLIPRFVFQKVGKFDSDTFFLYCDDVDFSWRVRLAGLKVIYQPSAIVFHDKRLTQNAGWLAGAAEYYYSAEAALLLSYKWSRNDVTIKLLKSFNETGIDYLLKAAKEFENRRNNNVLPMQLDPEHSIGYFVDNLYTPHRFTI